MQTLDFKKRDKPLYSGKQGQWDHLTVPPMTYLAATGKGDPDQPGFARAVAALYPLAYGVRALHKARGAVFTVPPLAALWSAENPQAFVTGDRATWEWTVMLRLPDDVDEAVLEMVRPTALNKLARKKDAATDGDTMEKVRLIQLEEGGCLQTLHLGPYSDEAPILADLHDRLMPQKGLTFNGKHHEIYHVDPRRVTPDKLKTILRQPIRST